MKHVKIILELQIVQKQRVDQIWPGVTVDLSHTRLLLQSLSLQCIPHAAKGVSPYKTKSCHTSVSMIFIDDCLLDSSKSFAEPLSCPSRSQAFRFSASILHYLNNLYSFFYLFPPPGRLPKTLPQVWVRCPAVF